MQQRRCKQVWSQRGRGVNWIYGREDPGHTGDEKRGWAREGPRDHCREWRGLGRGVDCAVTRPDARKHEPRACNKAQTKAAMVEERGRRRAEDGREDEREAWSRIRNQADSAHRRLLPNRRARWGLAQVWAEA
jgi:hypothetical protein